MQSSVALKGDLRTRLGKGGSRELRRQNKVPATLYAKGNEPISFAIGAHEMSIEYFKGGFMSKIVSIEIGKDKHFALPREVQLHPVTDIIEHVDFQKVDEKSEIRVAIPVKVIGAEKSAGIKRGGVLNIVRHTVEFFAKPMSIPRAITIDISTANIGDSIHISSVQLPEGVRPVIQNRDFTIATIAGRMAEEVIPTSAPTAEGTPAAGADSAAGAAAGAVAAPAADKGKDKK